MLNIGKVWKTSGVYYFYYIDSGSFTHANCGVTLKFCYEWFAAVGAFDCEYLITININDEPIKVASEADWVTAFLLVDHNAVNSKQL
jgi:hypothetical protein